MSRHKNTPKAPAEVLLHRDLSTNQQIGMILPICHTMLNALIGPEREHQNIPHKPELDGGAYMAAATTFINACSRLDKILDESARWGIDYQRKLEEQYNETHEKRLKMIQAQVEASEQQKKSAAIVVSPHFRYKPTLIPLEEGGWIAFLGNLDDLDSGIIGVGPSPGEALDAFDEAFNGNISQAVKDWLAKHEKNLERGVATTEPFPKNENDKKLEHSGSGTSESPSIGGMQPDGNSNILKPDFGLGGEKTKPPWDHPPGPTSGS